MKFKNIIGISLAISGFCIRINSKRLNKIKLKKVDYAKPTKADKLFDIDTEPYLTDEQIKSLQSMGITVHEDYSLVIPKSLMEENEEGIDVTYQITCSYRLKNKIIKKIGDVLVVAGGVLFLF